MDDISYAEALSRLRQISHRHRAYLNIARHVAAPKGAPPSTSSNNSAYAWLGRTNTVPLCRAVGQQCAKTIKAPHATPRQDSAAVDGFFLCSSVTRNASIENPVTFKVVTSSRPPRLTEDTFSDIDSDDEVDLDDEDYLNTDNSAFCVEVKNGTRFPVDRFPEMDAVISHSELSASGPRETPYGIIACEGDHCITVVRPVEFRGNRRLAGSDIQKGSVVINAGEYFQPKHILTLASLKFAEVPITAEDDGNQRLETRPDGYRRLTMGVLSIGSDLTDTTTQGNRFGSIAGLSRSSSYSTGYIPNSNGPYFMAAIKASNLDVELADLGIATDSYQILAEKLWTATQVNCVDMCVATGGFSISRWEMVQDIIRNKLAGTIVVQGVAVEPGKHILTAMIPHSSHQQIEQGRLNVGSASSGVTVFFGVFGHSLATVADFNFFVLPYLEMLSDEARCGASPLTETKVEPDNDMYHVPYELDGAMFSATLGSTTKSKPAGLTVFWLAKQRTRDDGTVYEQPIIDILNDQSCYKTSSLLDADCWVIAPEGTTDAPQGGKVAILAL